MPTLINIARAYILRGEAYSALQEHFTEGGFKDYTDGQKCMDRIKAIPAADVVEVRHGRFIGTEYDGYADGNPVYYEWICSQCACVFEDDEPKMNYCPNCGAKMDGKSADYAPAKPYDLLYEEGGPDA